MNTPRVYFYAMAWCGALCLGSLAGLADTNAAPVPVAAPAEAAQLAAEVEASLRALARDSFAVDPAVAGGLAIEAAVRTQDPAARLLSAEQATGQRASQIGLVYGLGVRFSMTNGQPVVVDLTATNPAATAGLAPGDRLLSVDGQATTNLNVVHLQELIRDDTSSLVRLTVQRASAVLTTETTRIQMTLESVELAEKLPRDLAYLKINGLFSNEAGRAVVAILRGWAETGRFGFVLDLRGAGGRDLKAVEAIGTLFAPPGALLCTLRDREDQDVSVHKAMEGDPLNTPVVVLVDQTTRDAAEVLAAVLADSVRGALLVGAPTAGDPLIRDIVELPGGRLIYLANRRLVTATGTVYDGRVGLTPDVLVTNAPGLSDDYEPEAMPDRRATLDQEREDRALRDRLRGDLPLRQAVDILLGLKALNIRASGVFSD
jgi:carboxyl-terminal processing protease